MFGIETYKHIAFLDALSGDKCHFDNLASNGWIQRRRLKSFSRTNRTQQELVPCKLYRFSQNECLGRLALRFACGRITVVVEQPPAAGQKPGQGDNN